MKNVIILGASGNIAKQVIESKASQNFIALLPLTLTLEDYNSTEKISNLPKKIQ